MNAIDKIKQAIKECDERLKWRKEDYADPQSDGFQLPSMAQEIKEQEAYRAGLSNALKWFNEESAYVWAVTTEPGSGLSVPGASITLITEPLIWKDCAPNIMGIIDQEFAQLANGNVIFRSKTVVTTPLRFK